VDRNKLRAGLIARQSLNDLLWGRGLNVACLIDLGYKLSQHRARTHKALLCGLVLVHIAPLKPLTMFRFILYDCDYGELCGNREYKKQINDSLLAIL